jgi:putative transposase
MVIIDVFSRRFVGFAVERGDVDGPVICRMFNCARANQPLPKYLSSDHDPLFPLPPLAGQSARPSDRGD